MLRRLLQRENHATEFRVSRAHAVLAVRTTPRALAMGASAGSTTIKL